MAAKVVNRMSETGMATEEKCGGCGNTYQRLPGAASGLCCRCRKNKRESNGTEKRDPVDPLAFDSQAALDEWYSADALRCHICGGEFPGLYRHVGRVHGIDTREYKIRFGIPMGYGLSGQATRQKQMASGAATAEKMRSAGFKNLAIGRAAKTGRRVAWTPYQARDQVAMMVEAPGHPSNLEGDVDVTCTGCGNPFPMSAKIVLSFQCRAECPSCRSAS